MYKDRCDDTYGYACLQIAELARAAKDLPKAMSFAQLACKDELGDGCNEVGYFYCTAQGLPWDTARRARRLRGRLQEGQLARVRERRRVRALRHRRADRSREGVHALRAELHGWLSVRCAGAGHFLATGTGGATRDVHGAIDKMRNACTSAVAVEACVEVAALLGEQHGDPSDIASLRITGRAKVKTKADVEQNPSTCTGWARTIAMASADRRTRRRRATTSRAPATTSTRSVASPRARRWPAARPTTASTRGSTSSAHARRASRRAAPPSPPRSRY